MRSNVFKSPSFCTHQKMEKSRAPKLDPAGERDKEKEKKEEEKQEEEEKEKKEEKEEEHIRNSPLSHRNGQHS